MDPITLQLYRHRLAGVAEEMGITLRRTAYSPNIKERLDFSCAVFDGHGNLIAQAAHIPAHLGAMPASVRTILDRFQEWQEGDVVIVNGDIVCAATAREALAASGADGVMIGRGAYGRPWFLAQAMEFLRSGRRLPDPPLAEQRDILFDLDNAIAASRQDGASRATLDRLLKTKNNLLRLWAED